MKELENLKEMYLDEIKKITKKGELSPADSDAACKALGALEKIYDLCDREKELEHHIPEYSERRGRNGMGQYTSRRATIDSMIDTLESMRSETMNDGFNRR